MVEEVLGGDVVDVVVLVVVVGAVTVARPMPNPRPSATTSASELPATTVDCFIGSPLGTNSAAEAPYARTAQKSLETCSVARVTSGGRVIANEGWGR